MLVLFLRYVSCRTPASMLWQRVVPVRQLKCRHNYYSIMVWKQLPFILHLPYPNSLYLAKPIFQSAFSYVRACKEKIKFLQIFYYQYNFLNLNTINHIINQMLSFYSLSRFMSNIAMDLCVHARMKNTYLEICII